MELGTWLPPAQSVIKYHPHPFIPHSYKWWIFHIDEGVFGALQGERFYFYILAFELQQQWVTVSLFLLWEETGKLYITLAQHFLMGPNVRREWKEQWKGQVFRDLKVIKQDHWYSRDATLFSLPPCLLSKLLSQEEYAKWHGGSSHQPPTNLSSLHQNCYSRLVLRPDSAWQLCSLPVVQLPHFFHQKQSGQVEQGLTFQVWYPRLDIASQWKFMCPLKWVISTI